MIPNNKPIHIFDLDGSLWNIDSRVWIIDKEEPHKPIIRINNYDVNKILNGLYKSDGLKVSYNGEEYFISNDLYKKINKKARIDIDRIGISWIEFYDDKYLNNTQTTFLFKNVRHLSGKDENICLLSGRAKRERHATLLNKLRKKLGDIGIEIYKIYFISDKFYYKINDRVSLSKVHILLEHLVGLKIEDGSFKPFKQDWYNNVYFYDDDMVNIDYANDVQLVLDRVLKKTDDELFKVVVERLNKYDIRLVNNLVTNNEVNLFDTNDIILKSPVRFPIKMNDEHIKNFNKFLDES